MDLETKYYDIKVGNKIIKARKWKAKDRKLFRKKLVESEGKNISKIISDVLVYNCLENPNIALTDEEIQYLFIQLRKISISDKFKFEFECENCGHKNELILKIDDVIKPVYKEYEPIIVDNITIEIQDIKNKKFYEENKDEYDDAKELAFRIKSFNGDTSKSFNELVEIFENMDINTFDKIYQKFQEMNFHIDNTYACECKNCGHKNLFEFDEIPGFFPDTWIS